MGMIKALPLALAVVLRQRGISQTELAQRAGMSKTQISRYLGGKVTPQFQQLERLLAGLGIDEALFFTIVKRVREIELLTVERPGGRRRRGGDPMLAMFLDLALGPPPEGGDGEGDGDAEAPSHPLRKLIRAQRLNLESQRLILEYLEEQH